VQPIHPPAQTFDVGRRVIAEKGDFGVTWTIQPSTVDSKDLAEILVDGEVVVDHQDAVIGVSVVFHGWVRYFVSSLLDCLSGTTA